MGFWTKRQAQYGEQKQGLTALRFTTGADGRNTYGTPRPLYQGLREDGYRFAPESDDEAVLKEAGSKVGFDRPERRKRYQGLADSRQRRTEITSGEYTNFGVLAGIENESGYTFDEGWYGDFDDLVNTTGLSPERLQGIYNANGKAKQQRTIEELKALKSFRITG